MLGIFSLIGAIALNVVLTPTSTSAMGGGVRPGPPGLIATQLARLNAAP